MDRKKLITIASNGFYAFAGLYGLSLGGPLGACFLIACLALTAGSSWFHFNIGHGRVARRMAAFYDEIGMYMVLSVLLMIAVGITSPVVVLVVWVALIVAALYVPLDSYPTLGLLALPLLLTLVAHGQWEALAAAVGYFAVGFGARQMDEPVDNGYLHAFWHLLTSLMFGVLIRAFYVILQVI